MAKFSNALNFPIVTFQSKGKSRRREVSVTEGDFELNTLLLYVSSPTWNCTH